MRPTSEIYTPKRDDEHAPPISYAESPPPPGLSSPTRFLFFVFYRDTQRGPLRRREGSRVQTFLSSTVENCFALAEIWMKYLSIAKAYEREICLVKKNFTKVALLPIFANINEFIIVKEQLIWLYQILLPNISGHCCPSYISLVTFFTYLEATHLSVFHRCSTRSSCNIQ